MMFNLLLRQPEIERDNLYRKVLSIDATAPISAKWSSRASVSYTPSPSNYCYPNICNAPRVEDGAAGQANLTSDRSRHDR